MPTDSSPTPAQSPPGKDPFDPRNFEPATPAIMTRADTDANTSTVKLLVFDMGHVFVRFRWEAVRKGFQERSGCTDAQLDQLMHHVGSLGYERGKISTREVLQEINQQLPMNPSLELDEFKTLWNATFEEDPEMAALLQSLKARYPLYLLSNTNEVHYAHLQDNYNVARHFAELILSYQLGYAKPDREMFEEVLHRSQLPAEQHLFVDDLDQNIKAAKALGMQTIQFVGIADLKQRLSLKGLTF